MLCYVTLCYATLNHTMRHIRTWHDMIWHDSMRWTTTAGPFLAAFAVFSRLWAVALLVVAHLSTTGLCTEKPSFTKPGSASSMQPVSHGSNPVVCMLRCICFPREMLDSLCLTAYFIIFEYSIWRPQSELCELKLWKLSVHMTHF